MDRNTDDSDGFSFSRRALLKSGVGASVASMTAGCGGLFPSQAKSYEFTAAPVGLQETPDPFEYDRTADGEVTTEREESVLGNDVTITLTNYRSVYEGGRDTLGLLASPVANVKGGGAQNPLATKSLREILAGDLGERLLRNAEVVERSDLTWERGPEEVTRRDAELLGTETTIRSFAGVVRGEGFHLVTAARVRDAGDVVLPTSVLQREGSAASLVGEEGFVTEGTVTRTVDRFETLLGLVHRTGVGLRVAESNRVVTDGPGENYVRVVVENQHDDKVLHSVGLLTQVFDDQGEFLDVQAAGIDRLRPDEVFEGYVPYFVDGAAGYAVQGHYTTRDLGSETVEDVTVEGDRLEGDTVSGRVRNTGSGETRGFTLRVSFYAEDGSIIGAANRQFPHLAEGGTEEFEADVAEAEAMPGTEVGDYGIEVLRYDRQPMYVR